MPQDRALSVTEAMQLAKAALEGLTLRVVGEVSEATDKPGYKAVYFTLGDGGSVMPCLVWRDVYAASGLQLRAGMLVEVRGSLTVYPPKGRLQFQVRAIAPAGEGILRMQVAQLARKLESEGLMRPERRRELPLYPERIGLVTSPRGKAVHDVLRTLRRRYPGAEVLVAGVAVEGADAVAAICSGIARLVTEPGLDVLIVARGGGSYEDLMPFNTEQVARAIAASPVPVVTGIGHEPDTTIADMVADCRASTPTAAAEAVSCAYTELASHVAHLSRRLARGLAHAAQTAEHRLDRLATRPLFLDPDALLALPAQRLDAAADALAAALPARLAADLSRLAGARDALRRTGPRLTERPGDRVAIGAASLEALSPLAILGRGYAVCFDASGARIIRSAADAAPGTKVSVRLHEGRLDCTVDSIEAEA